MKLMTKYHNHQKSKKNSDKLYIVKALDEKRHQIENEEKDDIYIYKEAKNSAYINQELLSTYGVKAKNQSYDISNFKSPIKLGKKKFFDPTKKDYLQSFTLKRIKNKGVLNLPIITSNYFNFKINNQVLLSYNNRNKSNISSDRFNDTKSYQDKNNKLKFLDFDPNKKNEYNHNTEGNIIRNSFRVSQSDKNIIERKKNEINKLRNRYNNLYNSNKNIFSYNGNYLTKLNNFKEQLIEEERKKRNYFNKNDYGCNLFKEKYAFLSKKYFDD